MCGGRKKSFYTSSSRYRPLNQWIRTFQRHLWTYFWVWNWRRNLIQLFHFASFIFYFEHNIRHVTLCRCEGAHCEFLWLVNIRTVVKIKQFWNVIGREIYSERPRIQVSVIMENIGFKIKDKRSKLKKLNKISPTPPNWNVSP